MEVSEFDGPTFDLGRVQAEVVPGERVPAYGPAWAVVDAIRMRHRLGEPVAYRALRRYPASSGSRPADLLDYARALGVEGPGAPRA